VLGGIPAASTGECVSNVRQNYGSDQVLWQAFEDCTNTLQSALENGVCPIDGLRENHRLLRRLEVIPAVALAFIAAVEQVGGAAKISGAGAVRGAHAGVLLVYLPDADAFETVMRQFPDYRWDRLNIAQNGTCLCTVGQDVAKRSGPLGVGQ
jgi:mevalonate kinase